jgi:hypothetical protein
MLRWRILAFLAAFALVVEFGVWALSRFVWPPADSICVGLRRCDRCGGYDFICGLHGRNDGAWYYRTLIPFPPTSILNNSTYLGWGDPPQLWGFSYVGYHATDVDWYYAVALPFWFVALMFGLLFTISVRKLRGQKRPGLCAKCGYDLRASPERCPECGTTVVRGANPKVVC